MASIFERKNFVFLNSFQFLQTHDKIYTDLRWEVIVCFVDIGGIVDHHCLNFLFIGIHMKKKGSVTYDRSVVFSGYSGFPDQKKKKWLPRYSWNIVESGVKHHEPNLSQTNPKSRPLPAGISEFKRTMEINSQMISYFQKSFFASIL